VGLYETFTAYGNEDLELFVRLRESGVQVIYNPEALAYQYYEKDFSALARDEISKGRTAILFARKHPKAYPETKLAATYRESPAWRLGRVGLVELSRILPATPNWVARFVRFCEKRRWNRLNMVYRFALDYFFWLGVRDGEDHPVLHG
jgi:GT2 family glycosyltransferase